MSRKLTTTLERSTRGFAAAGSIVNSMISWPDFRAIADRVEVVGNFPRLAEITPAPWASKTRTLCYAGGISHVRGIVELVDAMASVDAELLLAGAPSPASLIAELEQLMGPGVEQHAAAGLAQGEAGEIAPRTGWVHEPLDGCKGAERRANRALGG